MELVSILMPVYNVEKYVNEAISSLLKQTYNNIEIIVVDDCSTDKTYDIVNEMVKNDGRIKLYKNDSNIKISKTLNIAFSYSSGQFICRMDGDDISEPDRIQMKLDYLKEHIEIDLVGCSVKSIDENGDILGYTKMLASEKLINKTIKYSSPVLHIWMARRKVYEKLNGYRNIPYVEDYDFLLRMKHMKMKFTNLDNYYGYSVRLRNGNTISTAGILQRKAHRYCFRLYKLNEEFTIKKFNDYVKSTTRETKCFERSNLLLQKSLRLSKSNLLKKIILIAGSYVISREQRHYINGRVYVRLVNKLWGGD